MRTLISTTSVNTSWLAREPWRYGSTPIRLQGNANKCVNAGSAARRPRLPSRRRRGARRRAGARLRLSPQPQVATAPFVLCCEPTSPARRCRRAAPAPAGRRGIAEPRSPLLALRSACRLEAPMAMPRQRRCRGMPMADLDTCYRLRAPAGRFASSPLVGRKDTILSVGAVERTRTSTPCGANPSS
jgi:hypothetical protein